MKIHNNTSPFPMSFTGEDTLVVRPGADWKKVITTEIKKLDADGKTIVITDSHIFNTNKTSTYKEDLVDVLKTLNAKKIIFTSYCGHGERVIRFYVINELKAAGVDVELKNAEIHDRYWVCIENGKVMTANSLNGIGVRTSSIVLSSEEDAKETMRDLIDQGVIDEEQKSDEKDSEA